jgi:hypothetical protein
MGETDALPNRWRFGSNPKPGKGEGGDVDFRPELPRGARNLWLFSSEFASAKGGS